MTPHKQAFFLTSFDEMTRHQRVEQIAQKNPDAVNESHLTSVQRDIEERMNAQLPETD